MPPRQGTQGRKQVHKTESSVTKPRHSTQYGRTLNSAEDMDSSVKNHHSKGFNIARHVQGNVDHSSGSLSPDMDQFLQDITSTVTPMTADSNHPWLEKTSDELLIGGNHERVPHRPVDKSQRPKPHIAANFTSEAPANGVPRLKFVSESGNQALAANQETSNITNSPPEYSESIARMDPNVAATRIQQWYHERRDKHQQARVQSLLRDKRNELNQSKLNELKRIQLQMEDREQKEMERQKRREAKMQAARKAAIESLQKKREEKRQEAERIAQEEIVSRYVPVPTCDVCLSTFIH